jgi:hypothetical protein
MDILGEVINYEFGFLAFFIGMVATLFTRYSSILIGLKVKYSVRPFG